jgi:hypothetical protein
MPLTPFKRKVDWRAHFRARPAYILGAAGMALAVVAFFIAPRWLAVLVLLAATACFLAGRVLSYLERAKDDA